MIKGIAAVDVNGAMGLNGTMPWGDRPLDGKHFRTLTEGHIVLMGRKTWESMGNTPLPKRENIVLTRNPDRVVINDLSVGRPHGAGSTHADGSSHADGSTHAVAPTHAAGSTHEAGSTHAAGSTHEAGSTPGPNTSTEVGTSAEREDSSAERVASSAEREDSSTDRNVSSPTLVGTSAVRVITSTKEALALARDTSKDLWVIGGAEVYRLMLPYIQSFYLTVVEAEFAADVYFPDIDDFGSWKKHVIGTQERTEKSPYPLTFLRFDRI